jgi:outer membrane protein assembly factor BamB
VSKRKLFSPRWIKNLDVPHSSGNLPIGLQSPALSGGIVYIGHNSGTMEAFDAINGRPVWHEVDAGAYHAPAEVFDQIVVYGNIEGRLFARDRFSGALIYNVDLGSAIESRPVYEKGRLIVHTRNHKIVCLDALTGKILWAYKRAVPFLTTLQRVSTPLVYKNKVIVGFADGFVAAFTLEEGVLSWESRIVLGKKFIDVDTHPIIVNNMILMGSQSGPLTLINPGNGLIMRRLPFQIARAPLVVGENVILGTTDGEMVMLGPKLEVLKKMNISGDALTSIVQWKDHLIVGTTGGKLVAVDMNLEKIKEEFSFGHSTSALFGDLVKEGDTLAAYSSRNRLYVFR